MEHSAEASPPSPAPGRVESEIVANLDAFHNFVRARISDAELARDIVQDSLLKAIKNEKQVRRSESITAWFYRILRHSIIDLYRKRDAAGRALQKFQQEDLSPDPDTSEQLCACINTLLPSLKPAYAEVLREIDLKGTGVAEFAASRSRSPNAVRVKLHRARDQIRKKLEERCRTCAKHGCLDCTCSD